MEERKLNLPTYLELNDTHNVKQLFVTQFNFRSCENYQFLERSKVPTLHFQKSLPRLPIPELSKTCQRYLAAQTPILSADELAETTKLVRSKSLLFAAAIHYVEEWSLDLGGTTYLAGHLLRNILIYVLVFTLGAALPHFVLIALQLF